MQESSPINLSNFDPQMAQSLALSQETCLTCGVCSSSCPVSGVDDFDPRKVVRMLSLGLMDEVVESRWPWICTLCGRCNQVCPMEIDIAMLVRHVRSQRDRDKVPGILQKGVVNALTTGNTLGVPDDDRFSMLPVKTGPFPQPTGKAATGDTSQETTKL